jgi:hypothetical protein
LLLLARLHTRSGELADAWASLGQALQAAAQIQDRRRQRMCLALGGELCAVSGRWAAAVTVWAAYLSIMRDSELVETELSPRERELVTWLPRGGRTLRSRSSCSSASVPCAHTWTGSGTKLAAAGAPI